MVWELKERANQLQEQLDKKKNQKSEKTDLRTYWQKEAEEGAEAIGACAFTDNHLNIWDTGVPLKPN